jgi:hypothetical protein
MDKEVWKQLNEYHQKYWISNFGRIKSVYKNKVEKFLRPQVTKFGYKRIQLRLGKGNGFKNVFIHVLVAKKFVKNIFNKPFVNHKDSDRFNCFYKNLEWCTRSENYLHGFRYGDMSNKGNRAPMAKISEKQALEIFKSKLSRKELCKKYNLSLITIYRVKAKISWACIHDRGI